MLLMLDERDQSLVHRLLMATPDPGHELLPRDVVDALARLVPCDVVELMEVERNEVRDRGSPGPLHEHRVVDRHGGMLRLTCTTPAGTVATVSLRRRGASFTDRDATVLQMVEPVIARLLRGRARPGGSGLSGSERRVLGLVASGASNAEVADQLSVSVATVRKHLEHSYRKLGVTNRTAAVAALRESRPPALPGSAEVRASANSDPATALADL